MEAGHPGQDPAQRGGPRPARAGSHLRHRQHGHRPQPADHGDHEEGGRPATAWSACSTRSPLPASTAPASTTTGPSPPTPARTCWTRARRPARTLQFLLFLACIMKAVDEHAGSAAHVAQPSRATTTVWAPTRRRRPSSPCSWATSWTACARQPSRTASAYTGSGESSWTSACPRAARASPRTPPTATAPLPLPSPATSSSSAWWAPPISIAGPNIVLNTIVAEAFCEAADELEKADQL